MSFIDSMQTWHQTKLGLLILGLVELGLGYLFFLWATDSGSLLDWFLTIVLVVGGLQNLVRLILKAMPHDHKT